MGQYDGFAGLLLIGVFLNTYLFGIVTYQFGLYYQLEFNDPLWLRLTVHTLLALDTFHSASLIYLAWWYLVVNYNNPSAFFVNIWPYRASIIESSITTFLTQHFMGYRIYRMSGKRHLYIGIMIVSLADLIAASITTAKACRIVDRRDLSVLNTEIVVWLATQVILDFFIAGYTSIGLYKQRTDYGRTNKILYRCIRSAIQVGALSTMFALGNLIAFVTWPSANLYGMFLFPIGRIYTNALMNTLTVRASLRSEMAGAEEVLDTNAVWGVSTSDS
ncbi:hypothetical protein F5887DRAFT_221547 [Amanita rubescens]|nr:hypothetical protein F5887DRAFT_221547 [Amanita rubescens]